MASGFTVGRSLAGIGFCLVGFASSCHRETAVGHVGSSAQIVPVAFLPEHETLLGFIEASREPLSVKFRLENRGDAPLQVYNLSKSCSCIDASIGFAAIQPGESTEITLVAARDEPGDHEAMVNVDTNDRNARGLSVILRWSVLAPFEYESGIIDFGSVCPGEQNQKEIALGQHCHTCSIDAIEATSESIKIVAWKSDLETATVSLSLTAGESRGRQHSHLEVKLRDAFPDSLKIPIT